MKIDIYYSYACRESYLVYAWLNAVKKNGQPLDITWRAFAIQMDDPTEYWNQPWSTANSELRGFISAEAARRQSSEAFLRFHDALEHAVHEQLLELGDESTLIGAAQQAGLDVDRFRADWHIPQMAQEIHNSHKHAVEKWKVFGTPTLVLDNKHSIHLELMEKPAEVDALETFQAFETLASRLPYSRQLRLTD